MAAAATLDRTVSAQEPSKAQTSTLDAVALVGAFIRTIRLACRSTIASVAFAMAVEVTNSTSAAVFRAAGRRDFLQCGELFDNIDGWWRTLW